MNKDKKVANKIILVPVGMDIDLTLIDFKLNQSLQEQGFTVVDFAPFENLNPDVLKSHENLEDFLEQSVELCVDNTSNVDVALVYGLPISPEFPYSSRLNLEMAAALNAEVLFIACGETQLNTAPLYDKLQAINVEYALGNKSVRRVGVLAREQDKTIIDSILPVVATTDTLDNILLDKSWIELLSIEQHENSQSPVQFKYQLTKLAQKKSKTIVLPEGEEPRTIEAAILCSQKKIAKCVLLGSPRKIREQAEKLQLNLDSSIEIIDPNICREQYMAKLVELRKHKGMTVELAREKLLDNVMLGTMMLENDEVDGLVSGAIHTTANTIRPPLQIIKMADSCQSVSSIFFMLMPHGVCVFGDCAVIAEPDAQQLAQIAISSADSAKAFNLKPRVALLSYATMDSSKGAVVEKIKAALKIVKELRSDILIDGPLQYDAATVESIGKTKAPGSLVAGKANVLIFPDLNSGNITYKAVQRAANINSIGPMLQGMRKPVNDLSRGALVEDIVYTIALTAIQAISKGTN